MDATLRPDFHRLMHARGEVRSPERLAAHFEIEHRLRGRLLAASQVQRARVYAQVYSELFESLLDHPQHTAATHDQSDRVRAQTSLLLRLLGGERRYLEVGCGDAAVAFAMAGHAASAIGVDVTGELIDASREPSNFEFLLTDGIHLSVESASMDLVYSNQLMEHLHPDDAAEQLREIARVLKPGGAYLCITPSRFSGPHDISAYFGFEAAGFHLREYDYRSLKRLMLSAGFASVRFVAGGARMVPLPYALMAVIEASVERIPSRVYAQAAELMAPLFGLNAIARR